jgi:hypothetical protein
MSIPVKARYQRNIPSVLDDETKVVRGCKFHTCLDISRRPRVYTDRRDASLLTRGTESGIEVARLSSPVRERIGFINCVLHCTGVIGTPVTIRPSLLDFRATTRGMANRIARSCRWNWIDQRLRDLGRKGLEVRLGRPAILVACAAAFALSIRRNSQRSE